MNTQLSIKEVIYVCAVMATIMLPFGLAIIPADFAYGHFKSFPFLLAGIVGIILLVTVFGKGISYSLEGVFKFSAICICIFSVRYLLDCVFFTSKTDYCAESIQSPKWQYTGIAFFLYTAFALILNRLSREIKKKSANLGERK